MRQIILLWAALGILAAFLAVTGDEMHRAADTLRADPSMGQLGPLTCVWRWNSNRCENTGRLYPSYPPPMPRGDMP